MNRSETQAKHPYLALFMEYPTSPLKEAPDFIKEVIIFLSRRS
jgi:hypothetical protein